MALDKLTKYATIMQIKWSLLNHQTPTSEKGKAYLDQSAQAPAI